jgi:hypothetical protein
MHTKKAVCTIISNNYLAYARTLMNALSRFHPEWDRYGFVVDEISGLFAPTAENFHVVEIASLPLPNRRQFYFRYTILELNTAVKPWAIAWLFQEKGYDQVVYLDADIMVYAPLCEVEKTLADGAFAVLIPHLTGPLSDDRRPSELDILRAGTYNLGFLALARHDNLLPFLQWWQNKLEFSCVVNFAEGLFVDQKWLDLMPGMYADVAVLRHPAYNVAYWNLQHRHISKSDGRFLVNGEQLVFFHFSGLNPLAPDNLSRHQNRFRLDMLGPAKELVLAYIANLKDNGFATSRLWPYAFGCLHDGSAILDVMRVYYRQHPEVEAEAGDDPFSLGCDYWNKPWGKKGTPLVTLLMRIIWESRPDLRENFRDITKGQRYRFARAFVSIIIFEYGIPECYIAPVRNSLKLSHLFGSFLWHTGG